MSSPPRGSLSSPPPLPGRRDSDASRAVHRTRTVSSQGEESIPAPRHSPTLLRSYDPHDPDMQERQRAMDVESAMFMQRVRSASVAAAQPPARPPFSPSQNVMESPSASPRRLSMEEHHDFTLDPSGAAFEADTVTSPEAMEHVSQAHDPNLLVSLGPSGNEDSLAGLPLYQASNYRSIFDFGLMESFAEEEKSRIGASSQQRTITTPTVHAPTPPITPQASQQTEIDPQAFSPRELFTPADDADVSPSPDTSSAKLRQRRLSAGNTSRPRARRQGGKMALFEGGDGVPPPSLGPPQLSRMPSFERQTDKSPIRLPPPLYTPAGHDRPYRFSFYSNALPATIHARSLSELPAEGQSFQDLFSGAQLAEDEETRAETSRGRSAGPAAETPTGSKPNNRAENPSVGKHDSEPCTWWLDVLSPTDHEMKLLSKVFSIHPLTTEDIQMEEAREKIELFRNYYLVCFRSFDQDPYSPTYLEPLNMYIVVFREGTLSFHFRPTPHPQNVRRRIKQLKDYINVTSDWISYALIDDITDAFGPLIQSIEYEVDSIDELVLILKEAEQSDMLRRIGTCRKKVMGLLRLMGNKADVVKGLAKRCNENWSVAPKSDIGLYLSDIQDHLITMTQNLNHYEKILSRSHSNYLAQISIEMTDANNQINDVLSKLTALGTVLIPMNLITGLWGMNVHVPGQDDHTNFTWFVSIIGGLLGFALIGGGLTYKFMISRR